MFRTALLVFASLAGAAQGAEYLVAPDSDLLGAPRVVPARYEDTFVSLAREHNVGFESLRRANPSVDAWLPGAGVAIVIPVQHVLPQAPRRGVIVNVAELRLYYFPGETTADGLERVYTYPISIGRQDWSTPIGRTTVTAKVANPSWTPPQSIRDEHAARNDILPAVVPPGPDNPLGAHALRLGLPSYLIHGTNRPSGVGMRVTHGCIRMFPEDIEALFGMIKVGTPVQIVNQPFKLGWGTDGLYLEAHPPLEEHVDDQWSATELTRAYVAATEERSGVVDWRFAETVMHAGRGLPASVSPFAVETELAQSADEPRSPSHP